MNKNNRPYKITFRVSEAELLIIENLREFSGMSLSDLIRTALLTAEIKSPDIPLIDRDTYTELKRIGNNLNQVAKVLNSSATIGQEVRPALLSIESNISKLTLHLIQNDSQH